MRYRGVGGGEDRTVRLWDAETGAEVMTLKGHAGQVFSAAFSPDGKRIVTGSNDSAAKVWDSVAEGTLAHGDLRGVLSRRSAYCRGML